MKIRIKQMKLKNGKKNKKKYLKYETTKYVYDFQQYDTIRSFRDNIYTEKINLDEGEIDQSNLLKNWDSFSEKSKLKRKEGKDKKEILLKK